MLTSKEIRNQFIEFFKSKGHRAVPSAPVIPHGDPTLLFTNAGMNQFKDVFLGQGNRDYTRAVDTQKCIRVSGKHNDLEEVGVDTYHHTFFEMLGNWSFGDYYKEEAIAWAWELLTEVWGLPKDRLFASVFREDDEAFQIWTKFLPEERILRCDEKDNFWEMGDTGPCGPCSELHYDGTPDKSGRDLVNADDPRVIEIWNLVFIQYNRNEKGELENLKNTHVDTGMGLERIVRVLQGKDSNYDTDIFMPLIEKISSLSGIKYEHSEAGKTDIAMRVIADHIRTLAFSIADGAIPGNEGRGYVLRRILRRAARFSRELGFRKPVLFELVSVLVNNMGGFFKEIAENEELITKIIKAEEESFLQTLDQGLIKFEELANNSDKVISGEDAFLLYDSFGFPLDLTELIARDKGMTVDTAGFEKKMQEQKDRSRSNRKNVSQQAESDNYDFASEFVGYTAMESESTILHVDSNLIILDKTPFYVESGGQISDTGIIRVDEKDYKVTGVKKSGEAILHFIDGDISADITGKHATAIIDKQRRLNIMRNHSATHLLHEALKRVLGSHIQQQGSLVAPDYLRFDYNHFEKMTPDQMTEIENIVNSKILEAHTVETNVMSLEEAQNKEGLKMYFGDKYGETVRAVVMDSNYSQELCGGTHVKNTSEIGFIKITSESSIASGIRRIEAISGSAIPQHIRKLEQAIADEKEKEAKLQDQIKQLEKEISDLKTKELSSGLSDVSFESKNVNGINVVAKKINAENMEQLRELGDELRKGFKSNGIGLLGTIVDDKVQLVCVVSDDIKSDYPAGKIVGEAAKFLGGGGGGKPHMATAGGRDVAKLDELIEEEFVNIVARQKS
ncbi:MAG: alanine--tRNA ligase [Ignavibacteriae bacterium]|nr:alanine--tRNA ligase [Ignavibacteriota bacterium]MCB9221411.1 alanine--tRNA ligase [Ignavibacteria bacterium]